MKGKMKKKFVVVLLCAVLALCGLGMPLNAASTLGLNVGELRSDAIAGDLIVSLESSVGSPGSAQTMGSASSVTRLLEDAIGDSGFTVKRSLHQGLAGTAGMAGTAVDSSNLVIRNMGHVYLVKSDSKLGGFQNAALELRRELEKQGLKVRYIEPNHRVKALGITPAMHANQEWHYNMIKAPQAWAITQGKASVKIAVLDTGVDSGHVSLKNLVNTGLGRNFSGTGTSSDTMDKQGHGTHVAGTIASYGTVSGVMKSATLVPVKVLGDDGIGSIFGIVEGILYASSIGVDVINMSLAGSGPDQSMADACKTAWDRGTVVVAASGNDGTSRVSYPAQYPNVIAVGNVTSSRTRSTTSNYGTGLDVMAPGTEIYSTMPNNRYNILSGTSMAAPHVAGVIGLMKSVDNSLPPVKIEEILRRTCQPAGSANEYGAGIVDAYAAVMLAKGDVPPVDVTVVGSSYSDLKRWTSNYYGWKRYHASAVVYVLLSDGTRFKHGTISASSYTGYPKLKKVISGEAIASSNGKKVKYNLSISIDVPQ